MTRPTIDDLEVLTPDQLGELLLIEVCGDSHDTQYIQDLLDVGCPIDYRNPLGWTALHIAIRAKIPRLVKFLISRGADIEARDGAGWAALHWGAYGGDSEIIHILLNLGPTLNARDKWGRTPWDVGYPNTQELFPELNPKIIRPKYCGSSNSHVDRQL